MEKVLHFLKILLFKKHIYQRNKEMYLWKKINYKNTANYNINEKILKFSISQGKRYINISSSFT